MGQVIEGPAVGRSPSGGFAMRYRKSLLPALATLVTMAGVFVMPAGARADTPPPRMAPGRIHLDTVSSGARTWFQGPQPGSERPDATRRLAFGSNVDANDPQQDLGAGQSETAIAAAGRTVLAAWNDISGALVAPSTDVRASVTGVGLSTNGGRKFPGLIGVRNGKPNQQRVGGPTAGGLAPPHLAVGSPYMPSAAPRCAAGPAH